MWRAVSGKLRRWSGPVVDFGLLPLAAAAGALLIGAAGVPDSKRGYVIAGALVTAVAVFGQPIRRWRNYVTSRTVDQLKMQIETIERDLTKARSAHQNLVALELKALAEYFGYSTDERVSLFRAVGDHFELVGRWSINATYHTKAQRIYPIHEGVLGRAWECADTEAELSLPDPAIDKAAWQRDLQTRWGIAPEVSGKFRMPSCTVLAFCVYKSFPGAIGVVVFESKQPASAIRTGAVVETAKLKKQLKAWNQKLADLLEIHRGLME